MSVEPISHTPVNHVLVDMENVTQIDANVASGKHIRFYLFLGPRNKKLNMEVLEKLLEHSQSVQLIRSPKPGKNALDFVLAYHLGQAVMAGPKDYYHIVSKDGGFDSLVELLKTRHIKVKRHDDWSELVSTHQPKSVASPKPAPVVAKKAPAKKAAKKAATKTAAKKVEQKVDDVEKWMNRVLKDFKEHPKAQPKKRKKLLAKIANLIHKPDNGPEVQSVVDRMEKAGKLKFDSKDVPEYVV